MHMFYFCLVINVLKRTLTVLHYTQSFVYCRVSVLLIIDYSTKKGVLVYSRKCASEIVYFSF